MNPETGELVSEDVADHKPARAVVEVSALSKVGCVEIKHIVNG